MIADALLLSWIAMVCVSFFAPVFGVVLPEPVGRAVYVLALVLTLLGTVSRVLRRSRNGDVAGGPKHG
jgi:hypothetical protein